MRGTAWLGRAVGRIGRRDAPVILLYHRIAEADSDPWALAVSPRHFAEHLEVLSRRGPVLQARQLARALGDGRVPRRAAAITFDDGYADNLYSAKPALERYGAAASIFLATGFIGREREFWWDELERVVLQTDPLPSSLELSLRGGVFSWQSDDSRTRADGGGPRDQGSWRAWEPAPTDRHALYAALWRVLRVMDDGERDRSMGELLAWAGATPSPRPTHRPLTPAEVVTLARGDLVEIGAHTVSHPVLSSLPIADQGDEIRSSKADAEAMLGRPVASFSYPYGDYDSRTVAAVRDAGFACACAVASHVVRGLTDPFRLPRIPIEDWDGEAFSRRLSNLVRV